MSDKNLPIKLFKKRDEIDERRTEGGGKQELPNWVLPPNELKEKSVEFIAVLEETKGILSNRLPERDFIPAVIKVTLSEKALAKTHRNQVGKIFNTSHNQNFIGMAGEFDVLVKVDNIKEVNRIEKNFQKVNSFAHGLSSIEKISQFKPFVEEENIELLKVKLINFQNFNLNRSVEGQFEELLKTNEFEYKKTKYTPDLTIFKIQNVTQDLLKDIEAFEAIYSITPMPLISIGLDSLKVEKNIKIKYPIDGIEYPTVGVLDSGIERIPHLIPWLEEDSYSAYPDNYVDKSHGTFVAGVILYGDELQNSDWTGIQGCKLYSATVFPDTNKENITEDQLLENIRSAIESRPDIKIWNLSGGLSCECSEDDFSDFGKFLDDIQEKYNILICKSAGNCSNFTQRRPTLRIPQSADTIRSLVVGSIAHEKGISDLAEVNHPSPFSRIGHGPNQIIKPDLVHYGGNAGVDGSGRMTTTGVLSFSLNGSTVGMIGTSFSTPRVTSIAAGLTDKITEDFNPLFIKSLIIHSARYPINYESSSDERFKSMGYGLPSKIDESIFNAQNEITLVLQDTLTKGGFYEILDFPFPQELIEDDFYYGDITLTLVSNPVLDNHNSLEYCQSNIDLSFGTYDRIKVRDTSKKTIINEIGPENAINLLSGSRYSKKLINNSVNEFSNERLLRNYGKKFHAIKKYSISLDELTPANRIKALHSPKKWFLRLEGLYSSFAETQAALDGTDLQQEFCLIITIKDKRNNKQVYDSVSRLLDSNNFFHQNLKVKNDVRIHIEG